jgi:hypothetical protein
MFDEMDDSMLVQIFMPGAGIDNQTAMGYHSVCSLVNNTDPVGKCMTKEFHKCM